MLYNLTHALAVNVDRVSPGPFFSEDYKKITSQKRKSPTLAED